MAAERSRRALALALFCAAPLSVGAESLPERLAPCLACQGETGRSETAEVPSLGGQPADFLLIQLYQFREKQRLAEPMNELTKDFTDDDLREFSNALARLPPPTAPDEPTDAARMARGQELVAKHRCGFCHNPDFSGHDQIGRIAPQREDYRRRRDWRALTQEGHMARNKSSTTTARRGAAVARARKGAKANIS